MAASLVNDKKCDLVERQDVDWETEDDEDDWLFRSVKRSVFLSEVSKLGSG